jgi:hypothetical protein
MNNVVFWETEDSSEVDISHGMDEGTLSTLLGLDTLGPGDPLTREV